MIVAIIREGSCMGFVPLSGHYSPLQEATLRVVCKYVFDYKSTMINFNENLD